MTMNGVETIDEVAAVWGPQGKAEGAAAMSIKVQPVDRHRSDATVAWTTNPPSWQAAVLTAVLKLGMDAALTGSARAEVRRYLQEDRQRQNTGPRGICI
jgi:hypothetical protein